MANRNFDWLRALGREFIVVTGSFAPNGSSALVAANVKGKGFSAAYTSTGLYTITSEDAYADLVSFEAHLRLATGDDKFAQAATYDGTAKTMTIRVWDVSGAAVADVAADANNRISFIAVFKNLSVQ